MKNFTITFHKVMLVVWPLLAIPTLLWWKESVLWVAMISLYANWATEYGALSAAKADKAIQ